MHRIACQWLLISALLLMAGCGTVETGFRQVDLDRMGLQVAWKAPAPAPRKIHDLYVYQHVVVLRQQDNTLLGFARGSGKFQWGVHFDAGIVGDPYEFERFLYVISSSQAWEVDQLTGFGKRKLDMKCVPFTGPAVNQKSVVVSAMSDEVHAVSRFDGEHAWQKNARKSIRARPTLGEGQVFFASDDGRVYAVNESDGKLTWDFDVGVRVAGPIVFEANALYIHVFDGRIMALSRFGRSLWSRKVLWEWSISQPFLDGPILGNGLLFSLDSTRRLWVFDPTAPGDKPFPGPRWSHPEVSRIVGITDKYLYIATTRNTLKKLNISTGELVAEMVLPAYQAVAMNVLSGEVSLVDNVGSVYALKEITP